MGNFGLAAAAAAADTTLPVLGDRVAAQVAVQVLIPGWVVMAAAEGRLQVPRELAKSVVKVVLVTVVVLLGLMVAVRVKTVRTDLVPFRVLVELQASPSTAVVM